MCRKQVFFFQQDLIKIKKSQAIFLEIRKWETSAKFHKKKISNSIVVGASQSFQFSFSQLKYLVFWKKLMGREFIDLHDLHF